MRRDPDAHSWPQQRMAHAAAAAARRSGAAGAARIEATSGSARIAAGVEPAAIVLDPGFGFGKVLDENYPLLAHFDELHTLGYPLLAGVSRKAFLGRTLAQMYGHDVPTDQRGNALWLLSLPQYWQGRTSFASTM